MGCCQSRDVNVIQRVKLEEVQYKIPFEAYAVSTAAELTNDDTNDTHDAKVDQIESYMEDLLSHAEWKLHNSEGQVYVRSLSVRAMQSSKFNHDLPVTYVLIELTGNIAPGFILSFLNDPEIRKEWDKNYSEMQIVSRKSGWDFVMRTVVDMKFSLMRNREFVERKVIKQQDNSTNVLYYSCDAKVLNMQQIPLTDRYVRASTIFGFQKIVKKLSGVDLHLVCQSDMKLPLATKTASLVVSRLAKWAKDLKARLEAASQESNSAA